MPGLHLGRPSFRFGLWTDLFGVVEEWEVIISVDWLCASRSLYVRSLRYLVVLDSSFWI